MSKFEKYTHPDRDNDYVKVGFSFAAVFMSFFWLTFRKLWIIAAAFVVAVAIGNRVTASLMPPPAQYESPINWGFIVFMIALCLLLGFFGNKLVAANLRRKGYTMVETIETKSITDIEDAATWP